MLEVGLTGGIAAGKSVVAARLVELGAVLIDADAIARDVVEPGTPGLAAVTAAFGDTVLEPSGRLNRPELGRVVFSDETSRKKLNAIIHPLVRAAAARVRAESQARETADRPLVLVQDIPLLVETGQADAFDLVVTVQAPLAERVRRMVTDRGIPVEEAQARIAAQATDEERAAVSDVVLDNSRTPEDLLTAVDDLWNQRLAKLAAAGAKSGGTGA